MPTSSDLDVAHVARLARLNLTPEETALFQRQLAQVLEHAAKLSEVNVEGVEPAAHAFPTFNVFRTDEPRDSFTQEEALSNAPRSANGLFIVIKVVE
jgi:aspartyl-tRNA(Asn)/glutamyl-tRNA(Gln) amidotransferase subunit C